MIEPRLADRYRASLFVNQTNLAATNCLNHPTDTPQRKIQFRRQGSQLTAFAGCRRKHQLVVVPAGQQTLKRRCGVDAFEVANPVTRKQLARGFWPDMPIYMQPVGSSRQQEVVAGARPWARRPA